MKRYYVYKATNKINGKIYIGRSIDFFKRIAQHCKESVKNDNQFHKDIEEYGYRNFTWEILEITENKDIADLYEKQYIREYNSVEPNGYNRTFGGTGGISADTKPIICFEKNGFVNRVYKSASEAARDGYPIHGVLDCCEKLAVSCHGKYFMYEEDYKKNGFSVKEKKPISNTTPIVQCDTDGNFIAEFSSVSSASEALGIGRTNISAVLIGNHKTAGGYVFVYKENFPITNMHEHKPRRKGTKVASVDIETNQIISVYNSMAEAARDVGGSHKYIQRIVDAPNRTAYGFKWISQ